MHSIRLDSSAGFIETPLPFKFGENAGTKFPSSPRDDVMVFEPTTAIPVREGMNQKPINPGVLSGNGFSLPPLSSKARSEHGQVTSPDDSSLERIEMKPAVPNEHTGLPVQVEGSTRPAKSKNTRKSAVKTGSTVSSRERGRNILAEEEGLNPEGKTKRDQFLRRNRVAAHKCRQKKKEWMLKLDEELRDLSARNKFFHAEVSFLSNTIFELKNMILQHGSCRYSPIDKFIALEAERVQMRARAVSDPLTNVQGSSGSFMSPSTDFAGSSSHAEISALEAQRNAERANAASRDFGNLVGSRPRLMAPWMSSAQTCCMT